jgi:hypothetical protein
MAAAANPFDYFEYPHTDSGTGARLRVGAHWAARAPQRPGDGFDLKLLPRSPTWRDEAGALDALARVEREPWVERITCVHDGVELHLADRWLEAVGAELQDGDAGDERLAEVAHGQRFSVQFCDVDANEVLHVGHLRNLALGNALASALAQAGAQVERRSLILDELTAPRRVSADRVFAREPTLQRLAIAFDKVFLASDYRGAAAKLSARALALGLQPLSTHMSAVAYWMAAPGLRDRTSVHICGEEWISQVADRRELIDQLTANGHPLAEDDRESHSTHEVFHGPVSMGELEIAAGEHSELTIDELCEWIEAEIDPDPRGERALARFGSPQRVAAQVALGYPLMRPARQRVSLFAEKLLRARESPGWDLVCARTHDARAPTPPGALAHDPDYRFAVVQSELHQQQLRLAVERLDPGPLARHVVALARWYLRRDRSDAVTRIVHTALDRGARGLGLE